MNTRGESILLLIFEVLAVLLVTYILVSIAGAYGKSDTVLRINAAEDIRMMADTLVGMPGEVTVHYPLNVSSFSFILADGSITVLKKGEAEPAKVVRPFFLPSGYTASGTVEEQAWICLEKKGNAITLKSCDRYEP